MSEISRGAEVRVYELPALLPVADVIDGTQDRRGFPAGGGE